MNRTARVLVTALVVLVVQVALLAHSGPPFPIVTDAIRGPYMISIWTDPDATDDGTPGGQFWIVIAPSTKGAALPADTRARVSVSPSVPSASAQAGVQSAPTEPVRGDVTNQFGAVLMDHEGPYAVRVEVTGPMGRADLDAMVDATYDLRPPPYMLIWYLIPFLLAGVLWTRLLLRRRAAPTRRPVRGSAQSEGGSAAKAGRGPSDRVHVP